MRLELPEQTLPATIVLHEEGKLSDDDYFTFCQANQHLRLERTAQGEIVVLAPAGFESSMRNNRVAYQLTAWSDRDLRGEVCDSSVEFFLPDGAALSPDASWTSKAALKSVEKGELKKFPHICPEFVIEVMPPSDRLRAAQAKLDQWIANGVQLAWLIDGDNRSVYVYRPGKPVEKKSDVTELAGEGPVAGFVLELERIWTGV